MPNDNPQMEALKLELGKCVSLSDTQLEDIDTAVYEFKKEPKLGTAVNLQRMVRSWLQTRERYDLLHKIYSHGWGQEDTKHE